MLKNKILILFTITLCVFCFLCTSVYAVEETGTDYEYGFVYTDENGNVYNLPAYPEELKEYNHYVMFKGSIRDNFVIIPFNETIEFVSYSGSFDVLVDGKKFGMHWVCDFFNGAIPDSWYVGMMSDGTASYQFSTTNNTYTFITSCLCLEPYLNNIEDSIGNKEGFFLNHNQILVPIVEKTPLEMVLQEVVVILPVVLVVIVGLIAMRKALAFLIKILRQS